LSPPTKDGVYELKVLSGTLIPTLGAKTMKIGEYSKVNPEPEKIVLTPDNDRTIISNTLFSGNLDHHPAVDNGLDLIGSLANLFNGTRTPTSAIYLTNPAITRIGELKAMGNDAKAYDIYDSFLSTQYGKGVLNLGDVGWTGYISFSNIWLNALLGGNSKSFLDRINAQATLPLASAEPRNDLQTKFTLAEENFTGAFPLPEYPNLLRANWGAFNACYPWTELWNDGEKCDTDKSESLDGISRTCRVFLCNKPTIDCTCTRTVTHAIVEGVPSVTVDYEKDCGLASNPSNSPDDCSPADRRICAQNQVTCTGTPCLEEYNTPSPPQHVADTSRDLATCDAGRFSGPIPGGTGVNVTVAPFEISLDGAPSCVVSVAGPYECGGELMKDSELITKTAALPDNPRTMVSPQNVDSLAIANNELRKSWQEPFGAKLTYAPAAFESGMSSITDTALANDISKRKGTIGPGGDTQNGAITRSTFAAPLLTKEPIYNKINLHCDIDDQTGTASLVSNLQNASQIGSFMPGNWACIVNDPPNPEVVDLDEYLKTYTLQPACNLNPSDACRDAFFSLVVSDPQQRANIKFSTTFVNILNVIATRVNMPASVLLSIISGEGTSSKYGYYFTLEGEQELKDASLPWYGSFPGCDEMNAAAIGPYSLIRVWFNAALEANLNGITDQGDTGKVKDLLDELALGRRKTASRCNFLDSSFVAAAMLRGGAGGRPLYSCDGWTWNDAAQALRRFSWGWDESAKPDGNVMYSPGQNDERNSKGIFDACRSN
jgi:hypothetical protein